MNVSRTSDLQDDYLSCCQGMKGREEKMNEQNGKENVIRNRNREYFYGFRMNLL